MTTHAFLKPLTISLILAIASLFISTAQAGCVQSDLAGVWYDYLTLSSRDAGGTRVYNMECIIRISTKGNLTRSCGTPASNNRYQTSGKLKLSASCSITGDFGDSNGVDAFFKGQMDKSKTTLAAISNDNYDREGVHHFIKQ